MSDKIFIRVGAWYVADQKLLVSDIDITGLIVDPSAEYPIAKDAGESTGGYVELEENAEVELNGFKYFFENVLLIDPTTSSTEQIVNGEFDGNADGWETAGEELPSDNWAYGTNNVVHTSGSGQPLFQYGNLVDGGTYDVNLNVGGTIGTVTVGLNGGDSEQFGAGDGDVLFTGVWEGGEVGYNIIITPSIDFNGTVTNVSVKKSGFGAGINVIGGLNITGKTVGIPRVVDNFPNDAAAEAGDIVIGGSYHNNGAVRVRIV